MSMSKRVAITAVAGALALGASSLSGSAEEKSKAPAIEPAAQNMVMTPGKGLSLDIGGKHTMNYFETKDGGCSLMIVMAAQDGGLSGTDTPGTRIHIPVAPGKAVQVDASQNKSAEFICGPGGTKMSARIFEREPYKGTKS